MGIIFTHELSVGILAQTCFLGHMQAINFFEIQVKGV